MTAGDGAEKIVSREESAGRRQCQVRSARGVSAAEPERQPAAGRERCAACAAAGDGRNGTMPNNEPRKIKTLAVKGDPAETAASRQAHGAAATAGDASAAPRLPLRPPRPLPPARATLPRPMPAPTRRCRCAPQARQRPNRAPTRVAATNPTQPAPAAASGGGYLVQVSSQKNEADAQASYRALQGKFPSVLGSRVAGDQARRSRRKGRLLPRHGRSVRLGRRGLAVLQQPENRRRTVRRPKELTAVSLTRALRGA